MSTLEARALVNEVSTRPCCGALYCDSQIKQITAVKFSFKLDKNAWEIYENVTKVFHST